MTYLLAWLLLGCVAYMLALSIQLQKVSARVAKLESFTRKAAPKTDSTNHLKGLAAILLGPICFVLVYLANKDK